MAKREKYWYLAVTADKYELPLAVACTMSELARITGYTVGTISASLYRNESGMLRGIKFVRVPQNEVE